VRDHHPTVSVTVLLCVALALALPLSAADRDDDLPEAEPIGGLSFKDEVEITLVNVAVNVTDEDGDPVTDLQADDFLVTLNGDPREVSNFQLYTEDGYRTWLARRDGPVIIPEGADTEADDSVAEPRPMYITLFIDNENLHPLDRNRVLKRAFTFVRSNLQPPVQMMVCTFENRLKVVQPFTDQPDLVLGAIREQTVRSGGRESRDRSRREILDQIQRYKQDPGAATVSAASTVYGLITGAAEEEINVVSYTMDALRATTGMMAGLPGKKSIVYISNGLPMVAGLDLFYAYANAFDEPTVMSQIARYDQSRRFESLAAAANSQDISFYTISAGGLRAASIGSAETSTPQDPMAASFGAATYTDSLRFLAENTGGRAIVNTNDFGTGFDRITRDLFTYYSIGFPLSVSGGDKVHRLKVELPRHQDYDVRYRRRFVEKSLESQVQDTVMTSLMFPVDDNPLGLEVIAGDAAPASADRWLLPIRIRFPIESLALLPEGEDLVGRAVLFIAARDTEGKQSDLVRQVHEIRLSAADYEQVQADGWRIDSRLLTADGSYTVAIGLMDQITRQSSVITMETFIRSTP
jgi:VWFA-related protein